MFDVKDLQWIKATDSYYFAQAVTSMAEVIHEDKGWVWKWNGSDCGYFATAVLAMESCNGVHRNLIRSWVSDGR